MVAGMISGESSACQDRIRKVVCNFFFPSCGNQSGVHRPVSVCGEECTFVAENCPEAWSGTQQVLESAGNLGGIVCNDTASRLGELSGCCSGVNIVIPGTWSHWSSASRIPFPYLAQPSGWFNTWIKNHWDPAIFFFVGRLYMYVPQWQRIWGGRG